MKKLFTTFLLFISGLFFIQAQTLVTTQELNKNAVLEEYTGIHCQYCPQGHAIAASILANHPGRAVVIAVHQGGYAVPSAGEPDYRTPFGDALAGQTGLTGYPAGTVNRHVFTGSTTALNRGDWTPDSEIILQQPSPVNVGIETTFNATTRQLNVHVELYYTANSATTTNYINVALLQSHVFGPQTGGGAGTNYVHMHMLRYLVTGQWGDPVTTTTSGSLVERDYTYVIPDGYNSVPCVVSNCDVAVFVSQSHQEILSGDVVSAINGTNLYVGDISTTGNIMKIGHPGESTVFDLFANSNIAGSEPFKIKLVSAAPLDWNADFTIDGQTVTDSVEVNLEKGTAMPLTLNITPGDTAGFKSYTFELTSLNNPNAPVKYFTVYILSNVNTLLVNAAGDDNAQSREAVYTAGLAAAGCDKLAVMKSNLFVQAKNADILSEIISIFYNVAWTFPAFTDPEATAVKEFMDNGGHFMVAGQDIGWDIMSGADGSHGTAATQDLYTNYLKAAYVNDGTTANNKFIANVSDPVYGTVATSNVVDVNSGNMYPDELSPLQDASAIFYYNTALTKIGAVKSMKEQSKVVYFGIGLEMVQTVAVRNDIIKQTYDWFMAGVGIAENTSENNPSLSQNMPNPCSQETLISFNLPVKCNVSLQLYDLNGRIVRIILNGEMQAGNHQVKLITDGLNAGVYYYTMVTQKGKLTKKMVIVR